MSPTKPQDKAIKLMARTKRWNDASPGFLSWRDDWYQWNGIQYTKISNILTECLRFHLQMDDLITPSEAKAIITMLKTFVELPSEQCLPCWKGHDQGEMLAFKNCLYSLADHKPLEHSPNYLNLAAMDYDYIPEAQCPTWLRFLDDVYEGDADSIMLVQEWMGYCLTSTNPHHKMLWMVGATRSGKSTIQNVAADLVGKDAHTGFNIDTFGNQFTKASFANAKLATCGEIEQSSAGSQRVKQCLKSITGGDVQQINRKFKEPFSTKLGVKLMIAANEMPCFADNSTALAARILLLEHRVSFVGREDHQLPKKLKAEMSGIAYWALEGLQRVQEQDDFSDQRSFQTMVRHQSPTLRFLQDHCVTAGNTILDVQTSPEPLRTMAADLMTTYQVWCEEQDDAPTYQSFCQQLKKITSAERHTVKIGGKPTKVWEGLGLRNNHPVTW